MKWKSKKAPPKDAEKIVDNKKQSISSTQSMPFLRDDNLTFHRFTTNVSLDSSRRPSNESFAEPSALNESLSTHPAALDSGSQPQRAPTPTPATATMTSGAFSRPPPNGTKSELTHFAPVWTTANSNGTQSQPPNASTQSSVSASSTAASSSAGAGAAIHDPPMYKNSYTIESHDFQYLASSSRADSVTTDRRKSMQNGSTAKLMLNDDDQSNKQSKCSLLRGVILCLCLNFTYANVVRFPRELERHGVAFLVPYCTVLLLVGLPVVLLEIALGQFLGQGSAHAWRASPILKGASVLGRIACWLGAVWTSLQAVIAVLYIGELSVKTVPFTQCASKVRLEATTGYLIVTKDGQECLQHLLQTPFWEHGLYYALLAVGVAILWLLAMLATYSSRCLRRCIFVIGIAALGLLAVQAGWNMTGFLADASRPPLPELLAAAIPFDAAPLADSDIWFAALVQVIFSTGIGVGIWPVLTGKFLYKGDAVRTSMVYMCFNVFVCSLAVCFFVTQYSVPQAMNATVSMPELKPLTAIYDAATNETDAILARLVPGLAYLLIVLCALMTMATAIYTASRFVSRHPNYILSLLGLFASAAALLAPRYIVARLLDTPVVGVFAVCALIFDIMSITWIYGAKNIYTDLEFSIGRPILKTWVMMWCITPVLLTGVLAWWASAFGPGLDFYVITLPRWSPIVLALALVALVACHQVYDQVDYNCCSMIQEAAQSSTDWGPADPIVRHAWKQWRSVCEDTGQKDFTLRRRGTRDYTHSIKKGQYSRGKYGSGAGGLGSSTGSTGGGSGRGHRLGIDESGNGGGGRKSSSVGSNSPNYSGSIFEDSAIEEDVSVEKFAVAGGSGGGSGRDGSRSGPTANGGHQQTISYGGGGYKVDVGRKPHQQQSQLDVAPSQKQYFYVQPANSGASSDGHPSGGHNYHQQHQQYHNVSKIEIVPDASVIGGLHSHSSGASSQHRPFAKNPLGRMAAGAIVGGAAGGGAATATAFSSGGVGGGGGSGGHPEQRITVSNNPGHSSSSPYSTRRTNGEQLSADHICWRKFSVNSQEFSTEL